MSTSQTFDIQSGDVGNNLVNITSVAIILTQSIKELLLINTLLNNANGKISLLYILYSFFFRVVVDTREKCE